MEQNVSKAQRVTLKLIAERAGVDVSTVSRALSGSKRVKSETMEEIQKLAHQLNYRPNELARGLVTQKTSTVGVIVPEVSNSFYSGVLMSIEKELTAGGYSMILGLSHYRTETEQHCLDLFLSKRVDGLISFSTILLGQGEYSGLGSTVPAVLVDFKDSAQDVDLVASDNAYGVQLAVDHLVALGHQKIAFVTDDVTTGARLRAFQAHTQRHGLECSQFVVQVEKKYEEGGYSSIGRLFQGGELPTAVFFANDYMALGGLKALEERGFSVPGDVSVIGFDDSTLLDYLVRSITTVRQPKHLLGERAAKLLLRRMEEAGEGISGPRERVIITPELIVRDSTGPCRTED